MSLGVQEELDGLGLVEEYLVVLTDVISLKRKLRLAKKHKKRLEEQFPQLNHLSGNASSIVNKRIWAAASGNNVRRVIAKDEDEAREKLLKLVEGQVEEIVEAPKRKRPKRGAK